VPYNTLCLTSILAADRITPAMGDRGSSGGRFSLGSSLQRYGSSLNARSSCWARGGAQGMSWVRRLGVWAPTIVIIVLLLGSPFLAWAHSDPSAPASIDRPWQPSCQGPGLPLPTAQSVVDPVPWVPLAFILSVLMAGAIAHSLRQGRRVASFALVLVLTTFTFGTAVHSVHHLSEPQKAAECPVFSASQHISGTLAEPGTLFVQLLTVTETFPGACEAPTFTLYFRPDQPRASPLFPAL
jgi:hypothetical protein